MKGKKPKNKKISKTVIMNYQSYNPPKEVVSGELGENNDNIKNNSNILYDFSNLQDRFTYLNNIFPSQNNPLFLTFYIWSRGVGGLIQKQTQILHLEEKERKYCEGKLRFHLRRHFHLPRRRLTFVLVTWKGHRTSSREATPLGDPRGVPKFTIYYFQVFIAQIYAASTDSSKVGESEVGHAIFDSQEIFDKVLAYLGSKVGDTSEGFQPVSYCASQSFNYFSFSKVGELRNGLRLAWIDSPVGDLRKGFWPQRHNIIVGDLEKGLWLQRHFASQGFGPSLISTWIANCLTVCSTMLFLALIHHQT